MTTDKQEFISKINRVFKANGLGSLITLAECEKFHTLTEYMLTENEKYNLTAIKEIDKIILNHYADCAALAKILPKGAHMADIGCGAGFPTLPVAILRPDVKILAVDSTAKRIAYVSGAAELLGLTNVTAVAMRAEDGARDPEYRAKFDIATARAVAEMRVLTELCLGYVKVGGSFIAMKGKNAEFELAGAKKAISVMGGKGASVSEITLNDGSETITHPLITIVKKEKTPDAYPRPFAQISKKPL